MKNKIILYISISIIILIILLIGNIIFQFIEEIFVSNINYNMKIEKVDTSAGGFASNINYILINTEDKIAYRIYNYHVYGRTSLLTKILGRSGNNYKISKIKLTDNGINKLINYSNMPSNIEDESSADKDVFSLILIPHMYYSISYLEKTTSLKYEFLNENPSTDIHVLFDEDTKKY